MEYCENLNPIRMQPVENAVWKSTHYSFTNVCENYRVHLRIRGYAIKNSLNGR